MSSPEGKIAQLNHILKEQNKDLTLLAQHNTLETVQESKESLWISDASGDGAAQRKENRTESSYILTDNMTNEMRSSVERVPTTSQEFIDQMTVSVKPKVETYNTNKSEDKLIQIDL